MARDKAKLTGVLPGLSDAYEIVRELGRGGSSIVYLARDQVRKTEVAIKVIRSEHLADAEAGSRLEREVRILSRLKHPGIVRLLDTRKLDDGGTAVILEYVRGRSLRQEIRGAGPLPIAMVERILLDVAAALEHAAEHEIVHRDIKPENILLDEQGRALLTDFGIACTGSASTLTLTGSALGTPAYMSPEHIDGGRVDGRSDLYSLGMTAYEMLTGRMPWAGENLYTVIYKQKHDELPSLRELRPNVPPHLLRAVNGLMCKHPVARWSSAAEFRTHLEQGIAAAGAEAVPAGATGWTGVHAGSEDAPTAPFVRPAHGVIPISRASISVPVHKSESEVLSAIRRATREGPVAVSRPNRAGRLKRRRTVLAALLLVVIASGVTVAMIADRGSRFDDETGTPTESAAAVDPGVEAATAEADAFTAALDAARSSGLSGMPEGPAPAPSSTPARIRVVTGDGQTTVVGEVLASPIAVLVEDGDGQPVANARVTFRVLAGDGNVAPAEVLTDLRGRAAAAWAVGRTAGANMLGAVVRDVPQASVRFNATGTTGTPVRLAVVEESDQGSAPSRRVAFRVEDQFGNPVAGARVDMRVLAGGGAVEPATISTPETGIAETTWILGPDASNRIAAAVAGTNIRIDYAPPPFRLTVRPGIAAGGTHTCALGSNGAARCWGGNEQGQLGTGRTSRQDRPAGVLAAAPFARIGAGISHTCALDGEGAALCWGLNSNGQLGTGDRAVRPAPTPVPGNARLLDVVAGLSHTCALAVGGAALCWGAGGDGQIGHGATTDRPSPTPVTGGHTFAALSAGWRHTCGLTPQNAAWCWGANANGQLGDGTATMRPAPVRVAGAHRFVVISAGSSHTCGVTTQGEAYCWGQNNNGQAGPSGSGGSREPIAVPAPVAFASIAAGAVHTCGLTRAGEALCWGRNNFGQLGNESTTDSAEPVRVAGGLRFASLSASGSHTCGRTTAGQDYCWGYNVEGQVGDATRANRPRPVRVGAQG